MSSAPVDVGRDEARRAAAEELSRARYEDEGLVERVWRWFQELVARLLSDLAAPGVDDVLALAVLVTVLLGLAGAVGWALRRVVRRGRASAGEVLGEHARTAAEHRAAAERLAAQGDWPASIRERLRAVARTLEERGVVTDLPTRTAHELATVAGEALPPLSTELSEAARLFDAVTYGEHPGSSEDYGLLVRLDHAVGEVEATVTVP